MLCKSQMTSNTATVHSSYRFFYFLHRNIFYQTRTPIVTNMLSIKHLMMMSASDNFC